MSSYKVGIVTGAFDLLHAGHVHFLRECSLKCDLLIVALQVDPSEQREKNKPLESIVERQIKLEGCRYVDKVYVYQTEEELSILLQYCKPDIRFLGSDYKYGEKPITDLNLVPIIYIDSLPIHTSDIRERIKNER